MKAKPNDLVGDHLLIPSGLFSTVPILLIFQSIKLHLKSWSVPFGMVISVNIVGIVERRTQAGLLTFNEFDTSLFQATISYLLSLITVEDRLRQLQCSSCCLCCIASNLGHSISAVEME